MHKHFVFGVALCWLTSFAPSVLAQTPGTAAQPPSEVKGDTEAATSSRKAPGNIKFNDVTLKGPIDKSSPMMATRSIDDVRGVCSRNPNCRIVRDDAQLTAFCVGDNCVTARKAGKGQQEYLKVTMSDVLVGRISGTPIKTSQGIIAILIGNIAPPATAPSASKSGSPSTTKAGYDIKQNVKAPPAANLTESGGTSTPSSPGPGRAGSIRKDTVAPISGSGAGGPTMGQ
jgi:hypothetical protein